MLVSGVGGLLGSILATVTAVLTPYHPFIVVVFALSAALGLIVLLERYNRSRPKFRALDPDYDILEKLISFSEESSNQLIYRKRIRLRALRDGLDRYGDKYHWTGGGDAIVTTEIDDQEYRKTGRRNIWQLYEVAFNRSLEKGDEIDVNLVFKLDDPDRVAVPFVSATIEEPTEKLSFEVTLDETPATEAVVEESSHIGANKPSYTWRVPFSGKTASWMIDNPRLLHHYEMRWTSPRRRQLKN